MPRQARLDVPGLLQHVMARGIERREIFKDDQDRQSFLERLAVILEKTQTQCYAWALIPNHFHLLLRTGQTPLSKVMRRLMTGYAVTFNKRHKRSGHLFQNRYKSVVCEEDQYLLELIRYIHLNPLRAGLVKDLKELDKYPWTGHSAILGKKKNPLVPKQQVNDFPFAGRRIAFSQFRPRPPRLRESNGGQAETEKATINPENPACPVAPADGTGVNPACPVGAKHRTGVKNKPLAEKTIELILKVATNVDLDMEDLKSSKRNRKVSYARAVISYLAVNQLRYSASEVARKLRISGMGVGKCVDRGKKTLLCR